VGGGDLAEAMSAIPFPEHRDPVDVDWPAANVAAFERGPAHAGPDSFDDEVPLQFGDRADDDDDGPAERTAGIEVLAEAHVFDVEAVEFVQHLEEVADGSSDPIRGPDQHHLETAASRVAQQLVEARPLGLGAGDAVGIFGDDLEAALVSHRAEIVKLGFGVLVESGYAQIEGHSFHRGTPIRRIWSGATGSERGRRDRRGRRGAQQVFMRTPI